VIHGHQEGETEENHQSDQRCQNLTIAWSVLTRNSAVMLPFFSEQQQNGGIVLLLKGARLAPLLDIVCLFLC
jgi:hypothetical protein